KKTKKKTKGKTQTLNPFDSSSLSNNTKDKIFQNSHTSRYVLLHLSFETTSSLLLSIMFPKIKMTREKKKTYSNIINSESTGANVYRRRDIGGRAIEAPQYG
ncbi:hypothetical protein RYX36_018180, partial [Vicia faba]